MARGQAAAARSIRQKDPHRLRGLASAGAYDAATDAASRTWTPAGSRAWRRTTPALGFGIALDDVGQGYASLAAVVRLRPQVLTLDREIVRGLGDDPVREHLVRALADFARHAGIQLVAEGIETPDEVLALVRAGVRFGQGYLLGRPAPDATPPSPEVRALLRWAAREAAREELILGSPAPDVAWHDTGSRFLAG